MIESMDAASANAYALATHEAERRSFPTVRWALRSTARCICALVVFPVAFAVGLLCSLPTLVRAALTLALAALSLGWTAILLVLHVASVLLYVVGLTHQRKVLLTREGLRRLLGELNADLADLAVVPRAVARHTLRALKRGNAVVDRLVKTSRVRSAELLSTLGKRLQPHHLDFEDRYAILERLPSGGSTARLFVVRELVKGAPRGDKLVLKHFSLESGSHLENIVRESSAVKLATRLGIVRDSCMTKTSFYYVMPYYEGNTLTREVLALHRSLPDSAAPGPAEQIRFLRWLRDLLDVIGAYHERGVFHKDIKPDNLIASGDKLHLIDIGLLTPFESTLQLTTHGTEYFRDPEMVKLAVRGAAIKDVDCAKFDIYSMGAVLFFLLEGEFPSLGSLSPHRKRLPLCLQWIATRAMTDFDKRYASAGEMQADVARLLELAAHQPLEEVTVACLPSFRPAAVVPEASPPAPDPPAEPILAAQIVASRTVARPGTSRARRVWRSAVAGLAVFAVLLLVCVAIRWLRVMEYEPPVAMRVLGFDSQEPATPVALAEAIDLPPFREDLDREAAARHIAKLAGSFRQAVMATLPEPPESHERRLRLPILVVPMPMSQSSASAAAMKSLLRDVKLALATEVVPFEPDVSAADLDRLSDELRGLEWPEALGESGGLAQLLALRASSADEAPCVLGLELRSAVGEASEAGKDEARALLYHPRARVERMVRWTR